MRASGYPWQCVQLMEKKTNTPGSAFQLMVVRMTMALGAE